MKHLLLGFGILLVTLALCLGGIGLLGYYTGQTLQELRMAEQAMQEENLPNAADCARSAHALWERRVGFCGILLPHRETDDVNRHFARLLAAAAARDEAEFQITCAELIALVEHLPQMERAFYYNIL